MEQHPKYWNIHTHYGQCGQSCPCCRAAVGDTFGACPICMIKFNSITQMENEIDNKCDNECDNHCCKRKRKFTNNKEENSKKKRK